MENNGPCVCVCASATHHFFKRHGCAFVLFMTPYQSRYWSHLRALTRSKTSAPHHHHYYHHSSQEREESCCCCCAGCLSYCCSLRRIVTSPLQRLSIDLSFNPFNHTLCCANQPSTGRGHFCGVPSFGRPPCHVPWAFSYPIVPLPPPSTQENQLHPHDYPSVWMKLILF